MNDQGAPVSWHSAEILSSCGHTYTVQYEFFHGRTTEQVVERVSSNSVRPCPPPASRVDSLDVGDIVEVFHENFWKVAAVMKIIRVERDDGRIKSCKQAEPQSQYLVRLFGSSLQLNVDLSSIRMRRTWHDGKWILMGKNSVASSYLTATKLPHHLEKNFKKPNIHSKTKNLSKNCYASNSIYNAASFWGPTEVSLESRKRMAPFDPPTADRHVQKVRIVHKQGLKKKVAAEPKPLKARLAPHQRESLAEKKTHASTNIISDRCNQTVKAKHGNHIPYSGIRTFELCSDDNDACSVGSCSVNSLGMTFCYDHPITTMGTAVDADAICSDAESHYGSESESENSLPSNEALEVSVHWLEVHAYRSTLEALYISGPLTWEQEMLLTDLRMSLHISNDEHLNELKLLISTNNSRFVGW